MKYFKISLIATFCVGLLFLSSCGDDDDPVVMDPMPTADFTFIADEFNVTFTNVSMDATSYNWDFGDGNSSTDENPMHTYAEGGSYEVTLTARNGSNSDSKTSTVGVMLDPENVRRKSGFVVVGRNPDFTYLAKYFEEMPTGDIDLTDGVAFQTFAPTSLRDGAMFSQRTDGSPGVEKIAINGNNEFVEDGIFSTIGTTSSSVKVRDSEFGIFQDRNDPNSAVTFNPTTMEVTGSIDMSAASSTYTDPIRYQYFLFQGETIYGNIVSNDNAVPPPTGLPLAVIDGSAATSVTTFAAGGGLSIASVSQRYVDESGNMYVMQSSDFNFPTESGSILKINSGEQAYDQDYNFKVPEVANPGGEGLGTFLIGFEYIGNGMGIALANTTLAPGVIDIVDAAGGVDNMTPADWGAVQGLLFTNPTAEFLLLDLENQTTTPIAGMPVVSIVGGSSPTWVNDELHFMVVSPTDNALYKYDRGSNSASLVVNVTGSQLNQFIDLSGAY